MANITSATEPLHPLIDVVDLGFRYADAEFRMSLDRFTVDRGEKVAILGPSGSGKTTLLNLIAGILPCQEGTISVADQNVSAMSDSARRQFRIGQLGLVFQDFELVSYLNAEDNILLEFRLHRRLKLDAAIRERVQELTAATGLQTHLNRPIDKLSRGERQRVAICRALLKDPRVVLADEPTASLDVDTKQQVMQLLVESVAQTGAGLVTVTHDHDLVHFFDRVVEL